MSYYPKPIIDAVDEVALVRYINKAEASAWNALRREGELRLLTGWAWFAREGNSHRQGFKTVSSARRDAYYTLARRRLRLVSDVKSA